MFYVGQKVVCIDDNNNPGFHWDPEEAPRLGQVYTVRSVHFDGDGDRVLWLYEICRSPAARSQMGPMAGYHVRRFRPVVERKTDISIFTAMLNPSDKRVDA